MCLYVRLDSLQVHKVFQVLHMLISLNINHENFNAFVELVYFEKKYLKNILFKIK